MLNSVMVDLETMGNGNNAAIVSIGAFKFDLHNPQLVESIEDSQKFYMNVDLASSVKAGLKMDASTVMWWLKQERIAQTKLFQNPIELRAALNNFTAFMAGDYLLWGNGATFDNVILRSAYDALEMKTPWHYTKDACYRTYKNLHGKEVKYERQGVAHNALDDAITQGLHLQRIIAHVKGQPAMLL